MKLNKENSNDGSIIDKIFNDYGYGIKTWFLIIFVLQITNIQGINLTIFAYLVIPMKQYYDMYDFEVKVLSSIIFLGVIIGSFFLSIFSNIKRNNTIKFFTALVLISNLFMALFKNIIIFTLCRFMIGWAVAVLVPLSVNLLAEYLPIKNRFMVLSMVHVAFRIGQLLLLLIILLIMPNFEAEKVQLCLLAICFFSFITMIYSLFIKESPRSLIIKGCNDEAFEIINKYLPDRSLNSEEKEKIIKQIKNNSNTQIKGNMMDLFSSKYCLLSILLIVIGINSLMGFYGTLLTSSYTLKNLNYEETGVIMSEIVIILIGLVTLLLFSPLSEIKMFGRKGSFMLFNVLALKFTILCFACKSYYFIWYGFVLSLTGILKNNVVNYATEVYPTKIRDSAAGAIFGFGRIGAFISQLIYTTLYEKDIWLPYYFTAFLMFVNIILIYLLPYETHDMPLDIDYENEYNRTSVVLTTMKDEIECDDDEKILNKT